MRTDCAGRLAFSGERHVEMNDSTPKRKCPNCSKDDIESAGVTAAFYPRRVTEASDLNRGRKVVETRFRCRECGHEFTEVEEQEL